MYRNIFITFFIIIYINNLNKISLKKKILIFILIIKSMDQYGNFVKNHIIMKIRFLINPLYYSLNISFFEI